MPRLSLWNDENFDDINVDPASKALRVEIDATRQALRFLLYGRAFASRTAGNKRARARLIYFQLYRHAYIHCRLVRTPRETARIDGKFKCDRSRGREKETDTQSEKKRIRSRARTRVRYLSESCPTDVFKYRIWSTLPRRWDCASAWFSLPCTLHALFLVFPAAYALTLSLLFVYPPPHSHSVYIPLHLYFLRFISSYTYIPSRIVTDQGSLPS